MGGAVSAGEDNNHLVDNLREADYIKTEQVEKVFRAVDRINYYLDGYKDNAYKDLAWKHGNIHLSAPCIYSEVMEALKLEPNLSFLNIGSGTGYLSTMVGLVLGAHGINHGLEIHLDVIEFAKGRLDNFIKESSSFDQYELCEPKFVQGNGLLLCSGCRTYDRVYCGAACPAEHENYMKNLLKVGGVLVMPLEDQLKQITRVGQSEWDSKNILPVSFAPLILPSMTEGQSFSTVELPEVNSKSLQDLSRIKIRTIIRDIVNVEHPPTQSGKRQPRKPPPRRMPNCIMIRNVSNMLELAGELMSDYDYDSDEILEEEEEEDKEEEQKEEEGEDWKKQDFETDDSERGERHGSGDGDSKAKEKNGRRGSHNGRQRHQRGPGYSPSTSRPGRYVVEFSHHPPESNVEDNPQERESPTPQPDEQRKTTMEECLSEAFEFARSLKRAYDNGPPQDRKRVNDGQSECESMEEIQGACADDPLYSMNELADFDKDPHSSPAPPSSQKEMKNKTAQEEVRKSTPDNGLAKQQGNISPMIHTPPEHDNGDASNAKSVMEDTWRRSRSPPPVDSRPSQMRHSYPLRSRDHHARGEESGNSSDSSQTSSSGVSDDMIFDHLKRKKRLGKQRKKAAAPLPSGPNYLKEKIVQLPLPQSLISYLLYHREI
ncbi:protein-L-isoaspartate O-methyltransferase domain-containing protein 1-like [Asterias rubens]|uniref:protein-L-isoaspartate O-methyltransferase domain-containing protein 1-like n=1 Tax=Asterias rubens TaxID=7604 RepID=UPI001455D3ED|nr:protein-L-isoaspartate O-methyltransferase domain-containing protein 1-like [Asterias rubens]XP_033644675.1 protein-L-isoaspartate O-methyltransferase domain-containing protein 1-like [Asterias rubens]